MESPTSGRLSTSPGRKPGITSGCIGDKAGRSSLVVLGVLVGGDVGENDLVDDVGGAVWGLRFPAPAGTTTFGLLCPALAEGVAELANANAAALDGVGVSLRHGLDTGGEIDVAAVEVLWAVDPLVR